MPTKDEWKAGVESVINSSPNATTTELVSALHKKFPGAAIPTLGKELTNYAERGADGKYTMRTISRDEQKALGGGGGGGRRSAGGSGVSAPPATSGEAASTSPPPRPGKTIELPKDAGEANAIPYDGDDSGLKGSRWFRRETAVTEGKGTKSAGSEPWEVILANGDRWHIEIPTANATVKYKPRSLPGGKTDVEEVQTLLESFRPFLLIGHAGVGKTTVVTAATGDPNWSKNQQAGNEPWARPRVYRAVMSNLRYEALVGQFVPNERAGQARSDGSIEGQFRWQDGILTRMARHGGIFIADEINFTSADVLVMLNSLMDDDRTMTIPEHQGEIVHAHAEFRICGTMNPQGYGYIGTKPLNIALKSRFKKVMWYDWSPKAEKEAFGVSTEFAKETAPGLKMDSVHKVFDSLRTAFRAGELHYPPGMRDMATFIGNIRSFGLPSAVISFLMLYDDPKERLKALLRIRNEFPKDLLGDLYDESSSNLYS